MTAMTRTDTSQAEAFLEAAYARLIEGGVDAVKVAPLAEALTLTRTAFYWHFKDRESLLEALLARWEAKNTGNLIAQAEAFAPAPAAAVPPIAAAFAASEPEAQSEAQPEQPPEADPFNLDELL